MSDLNPQQQQAVEYTDGPILILAGAGSGKTSVITNKIAHLIAEKNHSPHCILAVTFTKKAANEMKERVAKILQDPKLIKPLTIGTFHSFGSQILRNHSQLAGLRNNFSIYDTSDQQGLIKKIMTDLNINDKMLKPAVVINKINESKLYNIKPENFLEKADTSPMSEVTAKIYKEYANRLVSLNAVDFNDLIQLPLEILEKDEEVKSFYQQKFSYILVDEYQDTNKAQYKIIKILAEKHHKLCAVGDADQAIYSWRGATIENIKNFERDYPEAHIIKLEQNYRSTQVILEAANNVISKNPDRVDKNLWTDNKKNILIRVYEAFDQNDEAFFVVQQLKKLKDVKFEGTVAVLYRTNVLSKAFEDNFVRANIPHRVVGGLGFYERMEIKDIIAYLKFINNAKDEVSFLRIVNTPSRGIGTSALETMRSVANKLSLNLAEFCWIGGLYAYSKTNESALKVLDEFINNISKDQINEEITKLKKNIYELLEMFGEIIYTSFTQNLPLLLQKIISKTHYTDWLKKTVNFKEELDNRLDNIKELCNATNEYQTIGREALTSFLEDVSLVTSEELKDIVNEDVKFIVNLMTIHAAKGLEFDVVFIVGLEEGIFPHSRSFYDTNQLEEERRLCYVAITRAKKLLYISYCNERMTYGETKTAIPSRYLEDIPENLIEKL